MNGATVENSAIAIIRLRISSVPISGTSQNFLRALGKPPQVSQQIRIDKLLRQGLLTGKAFPLNTPPR